MGKHVRQLSGSPEMTQARIVGHLFPDPSYLSNVNTFICSLDSAAEQGIY